MTPASVVEAVRTRTDPRCQATRCSDSGCTLLLEGTPQPSVLIHLEHDAAAQIVRDRQRCDYLFIGGNDANSGSWVVPVELTTGRKRASEFLAQLRGGAVIANELVPPGATVRFYPVAAHDRGLHRDEITNLRRPSSRINFRGQSVATQLVRCGSRLADVLQD